MLAFKNLVYCLFLFLIECEAKNYCGSSYCNNSKQHTLCKFKSADPARHCVDYEKTIKTLKEKEAILDKLNNRRNKVAAGELRSLPSARNMMKLEWDDELELSAQRWADQCVKHSSPDIKDSCRDLGSVYAEQNIATIFGEAPGLTPLVLVDVWYMELLNINASVLTRYQSSKDAGYSHYEYFTQLVWANSNKVGCGGVNFKERLHDSDSKKMRAVYRLVCNFAPGGNVLERSVYDAGPPCSDCERGTCDSRYTALCSIKDSSIIPTEILDYESTSKSYRSNNSDLKSNTEKNIDISTNSETDYDEYIKPYDFFSHAHDFVRPNLGTTAKPATPCKDLVIDDFVELLKKKLSTDPMFKDLLQTNLPVADHSDNRFTDAFALIGNIYSKNIASTTTNTIKKDYVNSTLLMDLVEAVIFRNGITDKEKSTHEMIKNTLLPESNVIPIKIQAELAEQKKNTDFTGHLFFPEDVNEDSENDEITELYYDVTNPSIPEVEIERQKFKMNKITKDFIDEILESEMATENLDNIKTVKSEKWLSKHIRKRSWQHGDLNIPEKRKDYLQTSCGDIVMKYSQLLQKLASDMKALKLNQNFHCTRSCSPKHFISTAVLLFVSLESYTF